MDPVGFLAVFGAFAVGPIIIFLRGRQKLRERELELQKERLALPAGDLVDENKRLRERIENLESIVCSVDFELNQKLAKVIDEQRSLMLPALGQTAGASGPGSSPGANPSSRPGSSPGQ